VCCRFLNRLLGLPLEQQGLAYEYFGRTLEATVTSAKSQGLFDAGIRHLGPPLEVIDSMVLHKDSVSGGSTTASSWSLYCVHHGVM
jgi:hypothetical protein